MTAAIPEASLEKVGAFVETHLGLAFPPERWRDLERGLRSVASEFGFEDCPECAEWIVSNRLTRKQLSLLAAALTVGETYFFRDRHAFDALENAILPQLIHDRAGSSRLLRFWSAGCSSGEEAYSMAILLDGALKDVSEWKITVLGTDINPRFLQKASKGTYTSWSFRGMDEETKKRYFTENSPGGFELVPRVKEMVTFAPLNLMSDTFPSLTTNTNAMDVIFCRNVLMYFSREQARKVVCRLSDCLLDDGYLFTSAAEASRELFAPLEPCDFPGTVVYRKRARRAVTVLEVAETLPVIPRDPSTSLRSAQDDTPVNRPLEGQAPASPDGTGVAGSPPSTEKARAFANDGRLTEALAVCDEAIAQNKLEPGSHYLRGVILQEQGLIDEAIASLRRALFLDQDFVLAHFAMANLMLRQSRAADAERHLENVRRLLRSCDGDMVLRESDGLTAGRLLAMLDTLEEARA